MSTIISIAGIIMAMAGTICSLWNVLATNSKIVGTAGYKDSEPELFKKQKKWIIVGSIFIVAGSGLQIMGLLM